MSQDNERAKRLIAECEQFSDFVESDDGQWQFDTNMHGPFDASELRIIADELDRRNKAASDAAGSEVTQ